MNLGEARQRAYLNGFKSAADQAAHPWTPADKSLPINQIVNGNSIELLNGLKPGWVDLVFADPPFNIGYLYHGYDDQKSVDEYLNFSEQWMRAVHRALKPTGSFYLAIGDEFADTRVRFRWPRPALRRRLVVEALVDEPAAAVTADSGAASDW